jgi:hypothetical protein
VPIRNNCLNPSSQLSYFLCKLVSPLIPQMALAAIVQAVPESVMMGVAEQETAKKVWDALKEMHIGEERVKKA